MQPVSLYEEKNGIRQYEINGFYNALILYHTLKCPDMPGKCSHTCWTVVFTIYIHYSKYIVLIYKSTYAKSRLHIWLFGLRFFNVGSIWLMYSGAGV